MSKIIGLYEKIITESLEAELEALDLSFVKSRKSLRRAEAGDRLAMHLSQIVASVVDRLDEKRRVEKGIDLSRKLIDFIAQETGEDKLLEDLPVIEETILTAVSGRNPDGSALGVE